MSIAQYKDRNRAELWALVQIQAIEYEAALKRIAELEKERDELSKFADWVLEAAVTGSDICGGDAQDKMFEVGILTREIYDPEIHALQGSECEEGDYIYFRALKEQGE